MRTADIAERAPEAFKASDPISLKEIGARGATSAMRYLLALTVLFVLSACAGRPLAEGERALAQDIFYEDLDLDRVRVKSGFRGAPASEDAPLPEVQQIAPRPGVCDRVAPSAPQGPPPGWALYNTIHFSKEWYREDVAPGWPGTVLLPQTLIMAHELVHVWQWQNRDRTGYRPAKAGLESVFNLDPYFYVPDESAGLLEYGFEQQAALLEDYMCYGLFDAANPRRAKLRVILAPYFNMDAFDTALAR